MVQAMIRLTGPKGKLIVNEEKIAILSFRKTETLSWEEVADIRFAEPTFFKDAYIEIHLKDSESPTKPSRFCVACGRKWRVEAKEFIAKMIKLRDQPQPEKPRYRVETNFLSQGSFVNKDDDEYRYFEIKVAGVTFDNEDGTNRQNILARLYEGEVLVLVPGTYEGAPSVRIDSKHGTIGYIPKGKAKEIANKIDKGIIAGTEVKAVYGGDNGKSFGVAINVICYRHPDRV